jgi:radical SAM protein
MTSSLLHTGSATPRTAPRRPDLNTVDFSQAPFLVIWETTQACDLACRHCRACGRPKRDARELTTDEAKRLMDTVRRFGRPLFIFTGGDPLKRPDIVELVGHGNEIGLRVAMTPSGTPLITPEIIERLADAGLARLAISLDGSTAEVHDGFRRVPGSYDLTVRMIKTARRLGLSTQINTTVSRYNIDDFDGLCSLMTELGIALWSVFFVVPTGRAKPYDIASPEQFERVFNKMYDLSKTAPFDIKSTAAPQYRRVILQRQRAEQVAAHTSGPLEPLTGGLGFSLADGIGRAKGVNEANGYVFVNHRGEIYPSGFMPVSAGNVRTHDLVDVYRNSPLFRSLRDPSGFKGKCGMCEFNGICGGSRSRAYALTGDPLESEPFCVYVPPAYAAAVARGAAEPVEEYFTRRVPGWHRDARIDDRRTFTGANES